MDNYLFITWDITYPLSLTNIIVIPVGNIYYLGDYLSINELSPTNTIILIIIPVFTLIKTNVIINVYLLC